MDTTVMLVDDEPSTLRLMEQMIQARCPGWRVVGVAENGQDALNAIPVHTPDLVIADIRMPVMDGLVLAKKVKQTWPQIRIVIASGHGDFQMAQSALRLGVADYMLKPIQPAELVSLMNTARLEILEERRREMLALLMAAMDGKLLRKDGREHPSYLHMFQAALVRANNFSSRFFAPSNALSPALCAGAELIHEHAWLLYGRDSSEIFALCSYGGVPLDIEEIARHAGSLLEDGHFTTIVLTQPFPLCELQAATSKLLQYMNDLQALGASQVVFITPDFHLPESVFRVDTQLERRMSVWLANHQIDELKKELEHLMAAWEAERLPYRALQQNLRKLIAVVLNLLALGNEEAEKAEHQLTEALTQSGSMAELQIKMLNLFTQMMHHAGLSGANPNSEAFFDKVREYIENNLSEAISLPALCDLMGISQSYMSKIFRKFTNMTFGEYLTERRMDRSKEIMLKRPELALKIVAELVGYKDALYFSKVFRAKEGVPPSRYSRST